MEAFEIPEALRWPLGLNLLHVVGTVKSEPRCQYLDGSLETQFAMETQESFGEDEYRVDADARTLVLHTQYVVCAYDRTAELIAEHARQGDVLLLEGRLTNQECEATGQRLLKVQALSFHMLHRAVKGGAA